MSTGIVRHRWALGIAAGGVLLGHWLTYLVVAPDAHRRAAELASTGHFYLGVADTIGTTLASVTLAVIFLSRLTHRDGGSPSTGSLLIRLGMFQVGVFVSMELLERFSSGSPLSRVLHQGILPIGVAIQLGVAVLGALAIRWLIRAADHVETILGRAPRPAPVVSAALIMPSNPLPKRPLRAAIGIRGPPALVSPA